MKKNKVFLITSGAYSNAEITSDFGLLPSAFLPIGHKRLVELQIKSIENFDVSKVITLPDDYILLERDKLLLKNNDIKIYRNNPNLSLAQSILSFINIYEKNKPIEELFILHGDTLFNSLDLQTDLIYYGLTDMFYKWGYLADILNEALVNNEFNQPVIAGYFSFSNPNVFKNELIKHDSFELALKNYNQKIKLNPVLKKSWLDFGHSNLYYKSKMELNVARNFNEVIANINFIEKKSSNIHKIESEFEWFLQLPLELSIFKPAVWGFKKTKNKASYNIEFIGSPTLQEKWVFGSLPDFVFFKIINQIFSFLEKTKNVVFNEYNQSQIDFMLNELYVNKTKLRIQTFSEQLDFNLLNPIIINGKEYPSLKEFTDTVITILENELFSENSNHLTLMHGDLCFSNILYDTRSNILKFIDPRGGLDNNFKSKSKIVGDYKYDIAKLGHSLVGNYDYIVTGFFNLKTIQKNKNYNFELHHPSKDSLKNYFYDKVSEIGINKDFMKASIVNLFISMLPLHNEDQKRQLALLCNAYKLFYD